MEGILLVVALLTPLIILSIFFGRAIGRKPKEWTGWFVKSRDFRFIIRKLEFKPDDLFLEIGCGPGFLLKQALMEVQWAVGIDHSPGMANFAENRNREAVSKGRLMVRLIDADSPPWPWQDETFTCAASNNVFMYLEHPDRVLGEIHRLLRPSGRLVIVTNSECLTNRLLSKISGLRFRLYKDVDMESLLRTTGFVQVEVKSAGGHQKCYARKPC